MITFKLISTEIGLLRKDNDRQQHLIGSKNSAVLAQSSDDFVTKLNQENKVIINLITVNLID